MIRMPVPRSLTGMKTSLLFRVTLGLFLLGLTPTIGFSHSDDVVGTLGPLTAYREQRCLGWKIKLRNDSDVQYTAIYTINGWADLKVVPPHGTVKAGYVLGREIPTFRFAAER
jgi:hypothetical protein